MPKADLLQYLGRPDQLFVTNEVLSSAGQSPVTNEIAIVAYLFQRPGDTTNWVATAVLQNGKVQDVRLGDAAENYVIPFIPYPLDPAPNQQGGANGRQSFSSEDNRASAAAASRRSP